MLILGAGGPADAILGIIEVGGDAVRADAADQEEVGEAGADTVDDLFVESALGDWSYWGWSWGHPSQSALSLDEDVA